MAMKELYMNRVLQLLPKCESGDDLLRELYYSFTKEMKLQRLIMQAMKLREKSVSQEDYVKIGFSYIERKIGCMPMRKLHEELVATELRWGSYSLLDHKEFKETIKNNIDFWKSEEKRFLILMQRQRTKLLLEKSILLFCNILVYLRYLADISFYVFVIVNTIGLIVFIILDYDCCVVEEKKRGKKRALAKSKGLNSLFQLAGGTGLIINLTIFALQWLEQEALF
jgi:hypothetical protein